MSFSLATSAHITGNAASEYPLSGDQATEYNSIGIRANKSAGIRAKNYIIGTRAKNLKSSAELNPCHSSSASSAYNPFNSNSLPVYSHFAKLKNSHKNILLNRLITLKPTSRSLRSLARQHVGIVLTNFMSKDEILQQFEKHLCTDYCLVTVRDAISCGLHNIASFHTSDIDTARQCISQQLNSLSSAHIANPSFLVGVQPLILTQYLHQILNESSLNIKQLHRLIKLHDCLASPRQAKHTIVNILKNHTCSSNCFISHTDALQANLPITYSFQTDNIDTARLSLQIKCRSRMDEPNPLPVTDDHLCDLDRPSKRQALDNSSNTWPQILSNKHKINIISDFRSRFTNKSFLRTECSFCGVAEESTKIHAIHTSLLNIDLLKTAVEKLHLCTRQCHIQAYNPQTIMDDKYQICHLCFRSIKKNKFIEIPLYAYSNNCWIGDIPNELQNLTFLEEQCIARARCTKCTVKIEHGPAGQYKAKGNACILPQEPASLQQVLPPPINILTDEIVVIFVATDSTITSETLKKSPLLVRRSKIINALTWLKRNNPLYEDVDVSLDILMRDYPENDIPKGFAIQQVLRNNMTNSESTSYVADANEDLFIDSPDRFALTSTAIFDTENIESNYRSRKLFALKQLTEHNKPFVKFPSANQPLQTWNNPALYTYLWPTLFPYGVGLLEDPLRKDKKSGFRQIHLKEHIRHLLNLKTPRFQTHLTFIYVMMNILQRRTSMFESKLACKYSWFPNVSKALSKISTESLHSFEDKLKHNKKHTLGETESEKPILELLKYVDYISENIAGSTSEVLKMREEIRSITRVVGLPHFFITINPADFYNPIYQVLAGRDINLDTIFHNMLPDKENSIRPKLVAENPIAGAKGFANLMDAFINNLLGMKQKDRIGLLGKVNSYYGVVESQHRGSLHCHFLIWLENALPPNIVRHKILTDQSWKKHLFQWLEDIISQDFPEKTHIFSSEDMPYCKTPIMSTVLNPELYYGTDDWSQDIRNVLENTGQIHTHNNTCYKHLSKTTRQHRDPNKDCRFELPRPIVDETYCDEDGRIQLKCSNGFINGYNDICVSCLRCNMDIKYIGSGTAALAMTEYVTNYIAKLTLDTSTVFTALCSAIKALSDTTPMNLHTGMRDNSENARLLLVKVCNKMIGKRELSGQQVASFLCNIPNHYTNHLFEKVFWTKILRFTTGDLFDYTKPDSYDEPIGTENNDTVNIQEHETELHPDSYLILDTHTLNGNTEINNQVKNASIIHDIFYRPYELEHMCLWELHQNFKRIKIPKNSPRQTIYRFHSSHPLYESHCLKRRVNQIIPVLIGVAIPRRDKPDQIEKHAAAMLTLFKPWSKDRNVILKNSTDSWLQAFKNYYSEIKPDYQIIINNMQSIYECRDTAHDFSKRRRDRLAELSMFSSDKNEISDIYENDPVWILGMQGSADANNDITFENSLQVPIYLSEKDEEKAIDFCEATYGANFYSVSPDFRYNSISEHSVLQGTGDDIQYAKQQYDLLMYQKKNVTYQSIDNHHNLITDDHSNTRVLAYATTLGDEYKIMQEKFQQENPEKWNTLLPYQQICFILARKYNFNKEQEIAFLIFADHYGRSLYENRAPIHMLIAGPGGTGKSQIFNALKEFLQCINHSKMLKICAPTGLAANNIGGTTIHSEVALRVSQSNLHSNKPLYRTLKENLENRFQHTTTLICDEIYFLGAKDNKTLSENLNIACNNPDNPIYGDLNTVFAGDPAQLPPPCATSLYNYNALSLYNEQQFNTLNTFDKNIAEGIYAWRQVDRCIILKQNMRQKEQHFQNLLNRLRFGNCNTNDYTYLQQFVLQNRSQYVNSKLLSIENWIHNNKYRSPLICYTNLLRDVHNYKCSHAFAQATGQEYHYYHAYDTAKDSHTVLKNAMAEAAWQTPIKQTNDLSGRLPLVPGMPVFLTENLATEFGLSNGSEGIVKSIRYYILHERRYPIYAVVHFPTYNNPSSDTKEVVVQPTAAEIQIKYPQYEKFFTVRRRQLPLIPAFAYTAHNSQGRSLNAACIDLTGCPNTATAYVMLSRIRNTSGVSILRPFKFEKISTHIAEDVRNEIKRLQTLHTNTIHVAQTNLSWFYN